MIWAILARGRAEWKYIKAAPPCWKGEVRIPVLWRWGLSIGWQKKEQA